MNEIDEALAEAPEAQAWLDHTLNCEYLNSERYKELAAAWQHLGAMLNKMVQQADLF